LHLDQIMSVPNVQYIKEHYTPSMSANLGWADVRDVDLRHSHFDLIQAIYNDNYDDWHSLGEHININLSEQHRLDNPNNLTCITTGKRQDHLINFSLAGPKRIPQPLNDVKYSGFCINNSYSNPNIQTCITTGNRLELISLAAPKRIPQPLNDVRYSGFLDDSLSHAPQGFANQHNLSNYNDYHTNISQGHFRICQGQISASGGHTVSIYPPINQDKLDYIDMPFASVPPKEQNIFYNNPLNTPTFENTTVTKSVNNNQPNFSIMPDSNSFRETTQNIENSDRDNDSSNPNASTDAGNFLELSNDQKSSKTIDLIKVDTDGHFRDLSMSNGINYSQLDFSTNGVGNISDKVDNMNTQKIDYIFNEENNRFTPYGRQISRHNTFGDYKYNFRSNKSEIQNFGNIPIQDEYLLHDKHEYESFDLHIFGHSTISGTKFPKKAKVRLKRFFKKSIFSTKSGY